MVLSAWTSQRFLLAKRRALATLAATLLQVTVLGPSPLLSRAALRRSQPRSSLALDERGESAASRARRAPRHERHVRPSSRLSLGPRLEAFESESVASSTDSSTAASSVERPRSLLSKARAVNGGTRPAEPEPAPAPQAQAATMQCVYVF